jgi:hypothetical protein
MRIRLVIAGFLALSAGACTMPRPKGAYGSEAKDAAMSAPDPMDNITDGEIPSLGGGDMHMGDGDGAGPADAGGHGQPGKDAGTVVKPPPDSPLVKLQKQVSGDYYLRVDFYSTASADAAFVHVAIDTQTTAFSLVRVGLDGDGKLKMIDWQCLVSVSQNCKDGCNSATTTFSSEGGHAYRPAVRDVTLNQKNTTFETSDEFFALGWKGNSAENPAAVLPPNESDPLVYDPDGNGNGVNVAVKVDGTGGVPDQDCVLRVLQKYVESFTGTAKGGVLGQGLVVDHGSDQVVLSYGSCNSGASARQSKSTTLRFVRATKAIDDQWTCPTEAQFRTALPAP